MTGVQTCALPISLASSLHIARCLGKEVVRKMYQVKTEGIIVEDVLFDFTNMISNYSLIAALYANKINNISEIEFISKSY